MWMGGSGGKGPPSIQPHKEPVCQAHDEQRTYPAVHPPHRESFPQDFSSLFFWVRNSACWKKKKKKADKLRERGGVEAGGCEGAGGRRGPE